MREDNFQENFNAGAPHPVQSFAWGEFRKSKGVVVERFMEGKKSFTILFHNLPMTNKTIGVLTQSHMPTKKTLSTLKKLSLKNNAIFTKIEPYVYSLASDEQSLEAQRKFFLDHGLKKSKPLYPEHSFIVDLTSSDDELLKNMKSKSRYNVRLSEKKDVKIVEDSSDESFAEYLELLSETTNRQSFYAHTLSYQKKMWQFLRNHKMAYLLKATHQGKTLSSWIVFVFNNRLYYPYGASTRRKRGLMAPYGLFWGAVQFGKKMKCDEFELWGSLGISPDKKHSWYGFHRFKSSFGGKHVTYVGSYDFILSPILYKLYVLANKTRWLLLRVKRAF
ncbi:lipid II:glycine glycyltransferase FemX [Patescibacteria group bacterium]